MADRLAVLKPSASDRFEPQPDRSLADSNGQQSARSIADLETSTTCMALSEKDLEEPGLLHVLCSLLETSDVEAVHVWLLHAPSLERALTLDLIRCALRVSERLDGDVLDLSDGSLREQSNTKSPEGPNWSPSASRVHLPEAADPRGVSLSSPQKGDESYKLEKSPDGGVSKFVYVSEARLNPPQDRTPMESSGRTVAPKVAIARSKFQVRPITVSTAAAARAKSRHKRGKALETYGSFTNMSYSQ